MSYLRAFLDGRHGPSPILRHTAKKKPTSMRADNIARFPGGSRGPPPGRTSGGNMGPGFRRDSVTRAVFHGLRVGDAGGELEWSPPGLKSGLRRWLIGANVASAVSP